MVSIEELQRFDLFQILPATVLPKLAERTERLSFSASETILKQGAPGDYFYVIWSGRVGIYREIEGVGRRLVNKLSAGEFFGEEALRARENYRNATVETLSQVEVLRFDRDTFQGLCKGYPEWAEAVFSTATLRTQFSSHFPQRESDEVGLVLVRRHPYALIEAAVPLIGLTIAAVIIFAFLAFSVRPPAIYSILAWALFTVGIGIGSLWIYSDWRNDLLIVTSKRVVHIERVLLYSESRFTSPIEQVRTVTTKTPTPLARILGYQDLVIQTGSTIQTIVFNSVENAEQIGSKILRSRDAAVARRDREEQQEVNRLLRLRLGLPPEHSGDVPSSTEQPSQQGDAQEEQPNTWQLVRHSLLPPLTIRRGNTVEWRRHWYILLQNMILPFGALALLVGFTVWIFYEPGITATLESSVFSVLFTLAWGGVLFGLFWQYEDWYNDYYIATSVQIIDRNSLPFGLQEQREVITFEAIQNVRVDIPKWTYKLLNMGHVYIDTIGGVKPTKFDSVFNPLSIQQEIFDRLNERREMARRVEMRQRSEELGDWFAAYHEIFGQDRALSGPIVSDGDTASKPRAIS